MKVWLRISIALLLALLTVSVVSAHAKLVKSDPAPSSVLGAAPTQVQLWFDEALDLNFSEVQVLDSNKQRIDTGALQAAPDDPKSVIAPLKPGGDGTYNVVWKVLSATDGHITRGVFAYGVGNTANVGAAPIDTGSVTSPNELSPLSATLRWLSLLSLLALVGGFIFRFFLLERSFDHLETENENRSLKNVRKLALTRWQQLIAVAFVLFFVSNFGELVLQANLVADQVSFTSIVAVLSNSRYGTLWLLRVGLIAICAVLVILEVRRIRVPFYDYALVVLGNVALVTRSLISHSASAGNFSLPVFADWLHLLGAALWVGGLFSFAWLMPFVWRTLDSKSRGAWIAWIIPQFSIMALGATVVIALTGIYNSAQQIPALDVLTTRTLPTFDQLTQGTYNDALLIKVAFFVVMICFGALNLLFLSPRFRKFITEPEKSARLFSRFRITVGAEVLLGFSAIFLAGILTLTPPPRSEPTQETAPIVQAQPDQPVLLVGYPAEDVQVQLEIGPQPAAPTVFNARVTDRNGNALPDLQRVIFNFKYLNEDTGAQNINAEARGDNQYVVEGNNLPLEGMWRIQVVIRRQGMDDQAVAFPYYITPATANDKTSVMTAQLELTRAQEKMNSLTTLRSTQDLNDGTNGVAVSLYEYQAPDKTKFEIVGQGQSIAIGADQYIQNKDGQWTQRARVENFVFPNFEFATTAQGVRLGRQDKVGTTPAQVILFDTPNTSGDELIHYAYWVADDDKRVLQFQMVTSNHYMVQSYSDFDDPEIAITAPTNVLPAPTAAAVAEAGTSPLSTAVQGSPRPRGFITGDLEGDGALIMVVVGVVVLLIGSGGKRARNSRLIVLGIGAASVLLGIGLFIDAVNGTMASNQNVPVNSERASTGQQVYAQNCAVCHGEKGLGDGPGGTALPVKPFDLTTHVVLHDEQYLYATILNGRGYMPAFGSRLTQDQILDVIAYTRLLARNAQQGSSNATPRPGFTPQP
ncbi:MAG: c-type cytochrome [Chloroflexota bacterium]|nr:MAG: c-type cytochrome [Chloroflexota bacterium]